MHVVAGSGGGGGERAGGLRGAVAESHASVAPRTDELESAGGGGAPQRGLSDDLGQLAVAHGGAAFLRCRLTALPRRLAGVVEHGSARREGRHHAEGRLRLLLLFLQLGCVLKAFLSRNALLEAFTQVVRELSRRK